MLETVELWAVAGFAAWATMAVLRQLPGPVDRGCRRWDLLRLVPRWALFANPTRHDFAFERRFRKRDGSVTPWEPLAIRPSRSPLAPLWNPALLDVKAAADLAHHAVRAGADTDSGSIRYRWLMRSMAGASRPLDAAALQFRVLRGRAYDAAASTETVAVSDFLPL